MKIVAYQRSNQKQFSNPKMILECLREQTGWDVDLMLRGVDQDFYKRKLKKKLDNIIAEAKKICIDARQYLTMQEYQ